MKVTNVIALFVLLLLVSCSSVPEYKNSGSKGPLKTFVHKEGKLDVLLINQGIKVCPVKSEVTIQEGHYRSSKSKSNYLLHFIKQDECYWSPMYLHSGKDYKVHLTLEEKDKEPREIYLQVKR